MSTPLVGRNVVTCGQGSRRRASWRAPKRAKGARAHAPTPSLGRHVVTRSVEVYPPHRQHADAAVTFERLQPSHHVPTTPERDDKRRSDTTPIERQRIPGGHCASIFGTLAMTFLRLYPFACRLTPSASTNRTPSVVGLTPIGRMSAARLIASNPMPR